MRPTFVTGRGLLVEAFLLDFDGDLYGRELRLDFVDRIRGEKRFDSAETLVEQMHRDVDEIAGWSDAGRPFDLRIAVQRVGGKTCGCCSPMP